MAARTSTMTHRYPPLLDGASVVVAAVSPMARPVLLAGQGAARGVPYHLGLVGALLGSVHRIRESGRHSPCVGHRVDPPCFFTAGGAHHGIVRLRERTPLLERSTILTDKVVDWHLSSPFCAVRPRIPRGRFNHNRNLRAGRGLTTFDHDHTMCLDSDSGVL